MESDNLADIVSRLSPDEQAAVREFIKFIQQCKSEDTPFRRLLRSSLQPIPSYSVASPSNHLSVPR